MTDRQSEPKAAVDALEWEAFCYVVKEMPEREATAFERRLHDDQAAREAVADAVGLVEMLAAAEADTAMFVQRKERNWERVVASLGVATAAGLILLICCSTWHVPSRLAGVAPKAASEEAASEEAASEEAPVDGFREDGFSEDLSRELVNLWIAAGALVTPPIQEEGDLLPELNADPSTETIAELDDSERLRAPSWMLAGLADLSRQQMPSEILETSEVPGLQESSRRGSPRREERN